MKNKDLKSNIMTGYEVKTRTVEILEPDGRGIASKFAIYHVYQDDGNNRTYCHAYPDYLSMITAHPELKPRIKV